MYTGSVNSFAIVHLIPDSSFWFIRFSCKLACDSYAHQVMLRFLFCCYGACQLLSVQDKILIQNNMVFFSGYRIIW